jgi:SRSO17 transposase
MHSTIVAPTCPLPECNLTVTDVEALLPALERYVEHFKRTFARLDQHAWAYRYLQGLLDTLPRKSCEPIALALGVSVRGMQAFIAESTWSIAPVLAQQECLVALSLGDADDGVFLIDESGMPKQGYHSAGVAHQYCGALGKVCSCQVGVFVGYASPKGYTLVGAQLFLPQEWFGEQMAALRHEVGLPSDLTFLTKPQIAVTLLQAIAARGMVPGRWVAADALYGNSVAFRDAVAALGKWYFTEVSSDQLIWRRTPALVVPAWSGKGRKPTRQRLKTASNAPYRVEELLWRLPKTAWTRTIIKEGSKGPIVCDVAFVRVNEARDGLPGPRQWLIIRRNVDDPTVVKFYLSNAPETLGTAHLGRMCGMRWPIEIVFTQMTKGGGFPRRTGWHDVPNLDLAIGDDDAIDEQFDQMSALGESEVFQGRLKALAEAGDSFRQFGHIDLPLHLSIQLAQLLGQPVLCLLHLLSFTLEFVPADYLRQIGIQQPRLLALKLSQGILEGLAAGLQRLRQPFAQLRPFQFVGDQGRLGQHLAEILPDQFIQGGRRNVARRTALAYGCS